MIDLIVLGASGSLSQKMIAPAIYKLIFDNQNIQPIGVGRSDQPSWWKWDYKKTEYSKVDKIVKTNTPTIFYLALPIKIEVIINIINSLKKVAGSKKYWQIAIEKPFGRNVREAKEIKRYLHEVFDEQQIYPVDHYLTKDLVKNIISFRFANPIIEQVWQPENIEKIVVTAWEKEDVVGRGGYYDQFGAIKDMMQNHLLQILSLCTIDRPKYLDGKMLSEEKSKIISRLKTRDLKLGQYKNYLNEDGVESDSKIETKAILTLIINDKKWKNVPLILQTGKKMPEKRTEVEIIFKQNLECLWQDKCEILPKNRIVINLSPKNQIEILLNHGTKIEQELPVSVPLILPAVDIYQNFKTPYEEVLQNIIDKSDINFASFDEIVQSWKLMEKVEKMKKKTRVEIY